MSERCKKGCRQDCQQLTKSIFNRQWYGDLQFKVLTNNFSPTDNVHSQTNLYKAYGHVKTILFFIGYPRSRHSLLGSLLDAHPHMVISDETSAFERWSSNPNKWMNNSIYAYYHTMFKASQLAVVQGRRSKVFKGSVANTTSKFRYYVPDQWQGSFDQYIEVSRIQGIYFALKSKDPIGISYIRALCIPMARGYE